MVADFALTLDEPQGVLTVAPFVTKDPMGGFFVADGKEAQVRRYSREGRLLRHFGREGRGPGEFRNPIAAHRLPSGRILVTDLSQGLSVFDSTGSHFEEQVALPPFPVFGLTPLSETEVLLVGRSSTPPSFPLLHVWNLTTQEPTRSFFPTPGGTRVQRAASVLAWADADLRGDTLAAVFDLVDTLYLYTTRGEHIESIPIPFVHFELLGSDRPSAQASREEKRAWIASVHRISDVYWLSDGGFLVQYMVRDGAAEHWRLLRMSRRGSRYFDLKDTPRLLHVDGDRLFFQRPDSELPNEWVVAHLAY